MRGLEMKGNNKGFTLVELIVATAILGIVTLAASGFMIAGSRAYSSLNYTQRLQYESQLLMEQLQEYLLDCSAGATWAGNTLYIVNNNDSDPTQKPIYVFTRNSEGQILFGSGIATELTDSSVATDLMAEHVTGMNVEFATFRREDNRVVIQEITVGLTMERNGKTYQAQQVIALRNQPLYGADWTELWTAMNA